MAEFTLLETDRRAVEEKLAEAVRGLKQLDRYSVGLRDQFASRFRGTRDALAWVLGHSDIAPLTRRRLPNPSRVEQANERAHLEEATYGRSPYQPDPFDYGYLTSMSYALEWAAGNYPDPPEIS